MRYLINQEQRQEKKRNKAAAAAAAASTLPRPSSNPNLAGAFLLKNNKNITYGD